MLYAPGWERVQLALHRNYLLPISSNIEQDEKDAPVAGVENTNTSTQLPHVDSEHVDAGLSGMVTSSTAGNTPRVVQINLVHLDTAHEQPRTDFHGGTGISVCWQIPVCLASGMHWSVCVSVSMSYPVCTPFSGEVQCEHTLYLFHHMSAKDHSFQH